MAEPNLRVRVLARALRELRERARMTQQEAGDRLRFTNRKMSRIETGQVPSFHELQAMLDVYGLVSTDWAPYVAMWERAREKGWWHCYGIPDRSYVPLEAQASEIRSFQLGLVHGLLQTEEYVRALFTGAADPARHTEGSIGRGVEIRKRRQRRLIADDPLRLHAIIDHTALRRQLPCMKEQLAHIVMISELDNVTFQVIPPNAGAHSGLGGSFTVLSFSGPDPDLAYVEHIAGFVEIEKEREVRTALQVFDQVASLALNHDESVRLVDRMAAEL
ncbi:helix-turn-helix domain-containing protein [Actinokineospora xionganensis]|uniref:Helix-turn-helix domain-containing protein n=1 Tax=Actinokineospora xionganensis TaxID=2684470 RepID=A0ABR7L990_9PSEU|nr:helix-turn-helix transcriptional regulator [Actinokineospora xionganensis]MBC6449275.1 helix-turn-helix domain-containing protein [Actinokineospora xionganensis]